MATAQKKWTLEELHSLPEHDGNKYELVHGELFVTPGPTDMHEAVAVRIARVLDRYVEQHRLGWVYRPRAVIRFEGSEVEPDLFVSEERLRSFGLNEATAPTPSLVIEIASPGTRRRDQEHKRAFYMEVGIPEYWIVDSDARTITVVKPALPDVIASEFLSWHPQGASVALEINLVDVFGAPRTKSSP